MPAIKHVHKYQRNKWDLWECGFESCTHFMPKNIGKGVRGSYSICWNCGRQFTLTNELMQRDQPVCKMCLNQTSGMGNDEEYDELTSDYIDYKTTTNERIPLAFEEYAIKTRRGHLLRQNEEPIQDKIEVIEPKRESMTDEEIEAIIMELWPNGEEN